MTSAVQSAQNEVAAQARPHAAWIVRLARAGYAAKGIVYLVIGGLALRGALGSGGGTTDSAGALQMIDGSAGGRVLLMLMGIGLIGYALWALLSAFLDAEDRGSDSKGIALRIGQAARGLIYGALGVEALAMIGGKGSSGGGDGAEHWSARVLALPWGRVLLGAIAVSIIGYAIYQLWRGAHKNLQKRLRIGSDPAVLGWVIPLARFGIIARAVVFFVIGWFLVRAARASNAEAAGGIGESLGSLASQPILLGIVAAGLMGYGVWQLANARYREMTVG